MVGTIYFIWDGRRGRLSQRFCVTKIHPSKLLPIFFHYVHFSGKIPSNICSLIFYFCTLSPISILQLSFILSIFLEDLDFSRVSECHSRKQRGRLFTTTQGWIPTGWYRPLPSWRHVAPFLKSLRCLFVGSVAFCVGWKHFFEIRCPYRLSAPHSSKSEIKKPPCTGEKIARVVMWRWALRKSV